MRPQVRCFVYPLVIIGLSVIACIFYWTSLLETQRVEMEAARHRGELHVQQINEAVDQQLDATIRSVDTALSHLRSVYLHDRKDFDRSVQDVLEAYPKGMIQFIIVIGAEGYLTYSSNIKPNARPDHIFFGDREDFRIHADHNEDQLFISKPIIGRIAGNKVIQITRPILDGKRFVGVIGIPLRPDYISNTLWSLHVNPNDLISIVREDGRIIARSRKLEEGLKLATPPDRPFMHSHPGEHGIFRETSITDKVPLLFSWRHLVNYPLIAVAAIDEEAELRVIYAQQTGTRHRSLLAMALVISFVFLISGLLVRINRKNFDLALRETELKENEAFTNAVLNSSANEIVVLDQNGLIVATNAPWRHFSMENSLEHNEQSPNTGLGTNYLEASRAGTEISVDGLNAYEGILAVLDGRMSSYKLEYPCDLPGKQLWFSMLVCPLRYKWHGVVISHTDITDHKQADSELRIAATAFESQEGMSITDASGKILRVNRAFSKITGYTPEEIIGKSPSFLKSGRHDATFYASMWDSLNRTGIWEGEIWNRRKNGEVYPEHLTITAVKNSEGAVTNYVSTITDITLTKASEDEIKHLAYYDPLTRLPNRRLLLDRLRQALASIARSGRVGALLFIDLDNFKTLNDTLGHDIGDILLQQVAKRLESCVREGDTVARLGGDEFVIMLEDLSKNSLEAAEQAESVGIKILSTLNQPYQLGTHEHHNTPSIGVTLFTDNSQSIDDLMKQADIAMYQSKKAGRNTLHFFDPKMQETIDTRANLERELHNALEKQQFQLFFQLQVSNKQEVGNYIPTGAEVLIRWIHPERGVVSPAEFIPLAEESGLILPIGQWVLDTACAQIKAWENNAITQNLVLAVNVSAKQFRQPDFVSQLKETVKLHEISPTRLKLELTESLLLEDIEGTISIMNELNKIGFRFSLDDFGTGYSSLQYLKRLPLDQIKIDQSFVRDIVFDVNDRAIVKTIIAMAISLNLKYIAEGVETEEQRQLLFDMGCTHYQGYLYCKPMAIEPFEALLKSLDRLEVGKSSSKELVHYLTI